MAYWGGNVMLENGILKAGLIGANIQKSRLPAALKIMCDDAGLDLDFDLIDTSLVHAFDFYSEVQNRIASKWSGVTVTHPYKLEAALFLKAIDNGEMALEVASLDASNTLVFDSTITGYNTDYSGFLGVWKQAMGSAIPGKVCMAGAGGVASAIVPALIKVGAKKIVVWDLDVEKSTRLAAQYGGVVEVVLIQKSESEILSADGLVNATALGMEAYPGSAFDSKLLGSQSWAFDAVYTPTNTQFLQCANTAGLNAISGFELFCNMAVRSFKAYTGIDPDFEKTIDKLQELKPE